MSGSEEQGKSNVKQSGEERNARILIMRSWEAVQVGRAAQQHGSYEPSRAGYQQMSKGNKSCRRTGKKQGSGTADADVNCFSRLCACLFSLNLHGLADGSWHLLMLLETSGPTPRARKGTMAKSCSPQINTVITDIKYLFLHHIPACFTRALLALHGTDSAAHHACTKACHVNSSVTAKHHPLRPCPSANCRLVDPYASLPHPLSRIFAYHLGNL